MQMYLRSLLAAVLPLVALVAFGLAMDPDQTCKMSSCSPNNQELQLKQAGTAAQSGRNCSSNNQELQV
jgi:hypothetical protein